MNGMEMKELYNEIIMENGLNSCHKKTLPDSDFCRLGSNPNCGDELTLHVKMEKDVIADASFTGHGCAISQASASVMIDVLKGKTKKEARELIGLFLGMIKNGETDQTVLDRLEDAAAFQNVSHMPARVKCALLAWHTMDDILSKNFE